MNHPTSIATAHQQAAIAHTALLCDTAGDEVSQAIEALSNGDGSRASNAMYRALCAVDDARNVLATKCGASTAPKPDGLDLAALAFLADPESRELLALLEQAQAVAERIDARRGRTVGEDTPLSPGESRGTDLAETISEIALRVRVDVHGPAGRD